MGSPSGGGGYAALEPRGSQNLALVAETLFDPSNPAGHQRPGPGSGQLGSRSLEAGFSFRMTLRRGTSFCSSVPVFL